MIIYWSSLLHQTLTKLRFSRNVLTEAEKDAFKVNLMSCSIAFLFRKKFYWYCSLQRLLEQDNFYTIRVPSNVLNPPGKGYIMSSVRAVSSLISSFIPLICVWSKQPRGFVIQIWIEQLFLKAIFLKFSSGCLLNNNQFYGHNIGFG